MTCFDLTQKKYAKYLHLLNPFIYLTQPQISNSISCLVVVFNSLAAIFKIFKNWRNNMPEFHAYDTPDENLRFWFSLFM